MTYKEFPIFNGQLIVVVQSKYKVVSKKVPSVYKLNDLEVEWVGNFDVEDIRDNDNPIKIIVAPYLILTPDREDKTLYFWNDSVKPAKAMKVPVQISVTRNKIKYLYYNINVKSL